MLKLFKSISYTSLRSKSLSYVSVRTFARKRPPQKMDKEASQLDEMTELWKKLEGTEFGNRLDTLVNEKVAKNMDENDLIEEMFGTIKLDPKDAEKKRSRKKGGKEELDIIGKGKEFAVDQINIDPQLEKLFQQEMIRLAAKEGIDLQKQTEDIHEFINQLHAEAENEEEEEKTNQTQSGNNTNQEAVDLGHPDLTDKPLFVKKHKTEDKNKNKKKRK